MSKSHDIKGYIHHTESFGTVDGPGIRFVIFLQGCPLRCLYCHNPDSIPREGGMLKTVSEMVEEIMRYRNFMKTGGVTFSGGEPLMQAEFVYEVSKILKKENIHIALDTAGYKLTDAVKSAIQISDLLLLDIKAFENEMAIKLTGGKNDNSFKTLDYCEEIGKTVWIRHVLLKDFTLLDEQLIGLAQRLKPYQCIEKIDLLPYHKLGEPKWESMGWENKLLDVPATTSEQFEHAKSIFRERGFTVI